MPPAKNIYYIAVVNTAHRNEPKKYDLEFLYLHNSETDMYKKSMEIANDERTERIIVCYNPVYSKDYEYCKALLHHGEITVDEAAEMLNTQPKEHL